MGNIKYGDNIYSTKPATLQFHKNGNPFFKSTTSTSSYTKRSKGVLPPKAVVPVIFLPGIMGTNLYKISEDVPAWVPPNNIFSGISRVAGDYRLSPATRQNTYNENDSRVFAHNDAIKLPLYFRHLNKAEAQRRGWGTIHWGSYGEFLVFLEDALNTTYNLDQKTTNQPAPPTKLWQKALFANSSNKYNKALVFKWKHPIKGWGVKKSFSEYTETQHKNTAQHYMPVHALGYNWLQSNALSAEAVAKQLLQIKQHYDNSSYFTFKKFILVTLSMGGLVARRLVQLPSVKNLIAGVVHGVQPVHGAPDLYRRFIAGVDDGFKSSLFGQNAMHINPVAAYSTGALELLPNKFYNNGKPWLFFKDKKGVFHQLPKANDPYTEIYL